MKAETKSRSSELTLLIRVQWAFGSNSLDRADKSEVVTQLKSKLELMPTNEELLRVRLVNGFPMLFHVTNRTPGEQILKSGFTDGRKTYGGGRSFRGVWLSNRAMWFPGIRTREAITFVLQFRVSLDDLADYEAIEDEKPYREWFIPAAYIRAHAEVKIADEEDQL